MRVTPNDQVLLALRTHLERLRKQKEADRSSPAERANDASPSATDRVREVLARSDLSERQMGRILVQSLLEQEFGSRMAGDPALAALSDRIATIIDRDPATRALLADAMKALRSS